MPIHTKDTITTRQDGAAEVANTIDDIIARAKVRDSVIWGSFLYNKEGNASVRAAIFGLYTKINENGYIYLEEVTSDELDILYNNFVADLQGMDADHTVFLAELWMKEYDAEVDDLVFRDNLTTKERKNEELSDYYDARIAALAVDEAALETKRQEVEALREKIEMEIDKLEAQIEEEGLQLSQVDVDIARQQLAVAKENQRLIDISIDVLEYQQRTNRASLELTELQSAFNQYATESRKLDARDAGYDADLARLDARLSALNADLIRHGVRLIKLDNDIATNEYQKKKIDLELIRESVNQVRQEAEAEKLATISRRLDAKGTKLAADLIELDARSKDLDATIERVNTRIAAEGVKIIRYETDVERFRQDTEKLETITKNKDAAQYRLSAKEYQATDVHQARVDLLYAQLAGIGQEEDYQDKRLEKLEELIAARKRDIFESYAASVTSMKNNYLEMENRKARELSQNSDKQDYALNTEIPLLNEMDEDRLKIYDARFRAKENRAYQIFNNASKLAKANITNTLQHTIGTS